MSEEYTPGVLPYDELSRVMPVEEPGTDMVSRTRRLLALTLAVQWTARDQDVTLVGLMNVADHFAKYVATGHKPEEERHG